LKDNERKNSMSLKNTENLLLYMGAYESLADAEADYAAVKDLHAADVIGTYDAAVVTKDDEGKAKIAHHTEKPTQHGGWAGLGVGAAIGLVFPPAVLGSALVGAGIGAMAGHMEGGLPRDDLKVLASMLDEGEAVLVVVAEPTLEKAVDLAITRAKREEKKQIDADAKELKKEIDALPS
jgi:uncharacterized membrane protein